MPSPKYKTCPLDQIKLAELKKQTAELLIMREKNNKIWVRNSFYGAHIIFAKKKG